MDKYKKQKDKHKRTSINKKRSINYFITIFLSFLIIDTTCKKNQHIFVWEYWQSWASKNKIEKLAKNFGIILYQFFIHNVLCKTPQKFPFFIQFTYYPYFLLIEYSNFMSLPTNSPTHLLIQRYSQI